MKQETLAWLAAGGRFTLRFEDEIGRLCREMSVSRVAQIHRLGWEQVHRMEMAYMKRLLDREPIS